MKNIPRYLWLLPILLLGAYAAAACSIDGFLPQVETATPTTSPTHTLPPPTPTPTATVTPVPSPTPVPAARVESGEKALFNGDWDTALAQYGEALSAAHLSGETEIQTAALLGLGRAYYLSGNHAAALKTLRELVDAYPDSPHRAAAFFTLAKTFDTLKRYQDAADAYQLYLALRPGLIDAYVLEWRGDALQAAGDYSSALVDYTGALQSASASDRTQLQIKLARTYAITGDYSTALVMYNDIYNRSSSDYVRAQMDLLIGQTYQLLGQNQEAYAAYMDAVDNYPLAYDTYLALIELVEAGYPVNELDRGLIDYFAGQHTVAVAAFDRYLNSAPADPATAHYYKGLSLAAQQNYPDAIAQWDVVIQDYPGSPLWDDAWEQKADLLWYNLGNYSQAVQILTDFVDTYPVSSRAAEFLFTAGRIAERDQDLQTAAALWERVLAEYPGSEYALQALQLAGVTRYRLEDYSGAQAVFERMLTAATNISERSAAYLWIGKCQSASGDQAAARDSWARAASSDPTGYYSERARDMLMNREPFTPSDPIDLTIDLAAEKAQAEAWMRQQFGVQPETDLSSLGPLAGDGRLVRGSELWELGLYVEARDEFEALRLEMVSDAVNTYRLADYFHQIGLYRSSILAARNVLDLAGMDDASTLTAPAYFNHIRFGIYFSDLVLPLAQQHDFHPLFVYSLIRQESLFEPFARSSAAARGLMQVIAPTGQEIHENLAWPPGYTTADLNRPLVSVTFGTEYLDNQRSYLDGDLYGALAAYNGGPGNARVWQSLSGGDPDVFVEVVRFEETRRYIRSIYEIFTIYRRLYTRTP